MRRKVMENLSDACCYTYYISVTKYLGAML